LANFGEHFEWDEAKEISNLARHGVAFVEAVAAFADPRRIILPDVSHSHSEPRWYCVGQVGDYSYCAVHAAAWPDSRHRRGLLAQRQTNL
jgi:hypothetical protein